MIHPAVLIEFLIIIGVAIELRPYTNHETATHLMNTVEHSLRIGEARSLKLMRAPLILLPIVPVLHNVIAGNLSLAELGQGADDFVGSLIALTTLPET